jgi:hypothetical protein
MKCEAYQKHLVFLLVGSNVVIHRLTLHFDACAGEVLLYNIFYEVFTVCTSIVAQDNSGQDFPHLFASFLMKSISQQENYTMVVIWTLVFFLGKQSSSCFFYVLIMSILLTVLFYLMFVQFATFSHFLCDMGNWALHGTGLEKKAFVNSCLYENLCNLKVSSMAS